MAKRPNKPTTELTRRQRSRAAREARLQQAVWVGVIAVVVIVIGLLGYAALNEYVLKPNRPIATVEDESISVKDFQDQVLLDWYLQANGQPLSQFGLDAEFFADYSLESAINGILMKQQAEEMGITISDEELEEEIQLAFGYDAGEPEPTATAAPTLPGIVDDPTPTATFVLTLTPSPAPTLEAGVTPTATLSPTATPSEPPTATPTLAPLPTAEPLTEDDFDEQFDTFVQSGVAVTGLAEERFVELWREQVRLILLRRSMTEALDIEVDDTKTLVHAAHILVATEEEINEVVERLNNGEDFELVAAEVSLDSSNAFRGGDLGWFGRNRMDPAFEEVAFSLEPGEISEPVETQFGWHVVKLYDREEVPASALEQDQQRQEAMADLIEEWRNAADVEIVEDWERFIPEALQ